MLAMPLPLRPSSLTSVAFSDDGKWLATADGIGRLSVRHSQSDVFQLVLESPLGAGIQQVAFLDSSDTILCRDDEGRLLVCDVPSQKLIQTIGQDASIVAFAVDKQRRRVLTISASQKLSEWTVDVTREQTLIETKVLDIDYPFTRLSISEVGQTVLLASDDRWQVRRLSDLKRRLEGTVDTEIITAIQVSPDGSVFAVGFEDGKIRVRESGRGTLRCSWNKHPNKVVSFTFSKTSKTLISGCAKDRIRMWDLDVGEHANNRSIAVNAVGCLRLSPDDQHLAVVGASPFANLLQSRQPAREVAAIAKPHTWNAKAAFAVRFVSQQKKMYVVPKRSTAQSIDLASPDLDSVKVTAGFDVDLGNDRLNHADVASDGSLSGHAYKSGIIRLHDVETGALHRQFSHPSSAAWVQFDPTSKRLALLWHQPSPRMSVVDVETGDITMAPVDLRVTDVESVCWSPDSQAVYTIGRRSSGFGRSGVVSKWSVDDGRLLAEVEDSQITGRMAVSPDGSRVVTGGITGIISVYDGQLELKNIFECGGRGGLHAYCFLNNRQLVVGTFKGSVVMVDVETGIELSRFEPLPPRIGMPIRAIDYDPSRRLLAAVGGYDGQETTRLYRLEELTR